MIVFIYRLINSDYVLDWEKSESNILIRYKNTFSAFKKRREGTGSDHENWLWFCHSMSYWSYCYFFLCQVCVLFISCTLSMNFL